MERFSPPSIGSLSGVLQHLLHPFYLSAALPPLCLEGLLAKGQRSPAAGLAWSTKQKPTDILSAGNVESKGQPLFLLHWESQSGLG